MTEPTAAEIERAIDHEGDGYWEACGADVARTLLKYLQAAEARVAALEAQLEKHTDPSRWP